MKPEENEHIIEEFLENNKDFYLEDPWKTYLKQIRDLPKGYNEKKEYIQLYPNKHGVDGFFIAKLKKRS